MQRIEGFDSFGNSFDIGQEAGFSLIGQDSNHDWVNPSIETVVATPEPASMGLVGLGLFAFGIAGRRLRRPAVQA